MRKSNFFVGMLAVAGMFFATSCSQDEIFNESVNGDFVNATFTIGAENGIGTRAVGEGLTANTVVCAVFDANGEEMVNLREYLPVVNKTAIYSKRLAKGQDYRVAFFAYNADATGRTSAYYDVTNMKSIKVLGNQASNVEERDAFTAFVDIDGSELTNLSNVEKDVTLYRPFAQLNLGVDGTELQDAANAGVVITNTAITVTNVWNAFNAYDDDIADDAVAAPMEFALNAVPTQKLTVNGAEYTYLALNYLLVGDKGLEKSLSDVEFKWQTANGKTNEPTTHFVNIPVQRNYRTNIIGKLLTTPADFNIVIDAAFENPDYVEEVETVISKTVNNAAELQAAIDAAPVGQTRIVLAEPISGNITVNQNKDVQILIDGQNKAFNGKITVNGGSEWGGTEGLSIQNIHFMSFAADGNIITVGENSGSSRYAHNVTITGCKFVYMNGYDANCKVVGISAYQANDITVNACTFSRLHSVAQITGGNNIKFQEVTSTNCVRGISLGSATNALITKCNITALGDKKYGIRHNADYENTGLKIVESTINAWIPVVVRRTNTVVVENYTLTFEGVNNLTKGADSAYDVAIADKEYDEVGETLTRLPGNTGNVEVTGADASWSIFK